MSYAEEYFPIFAVTPLPLGIFFVAFIGALNAIIQNWSQAAQNYILTPCFKLPQGVIAEESADFLRN